MALVMLPCDMPWWGKLQFLLTEIATVTTPKDLADNMFQIYSMCNVGLDPDESDHSKTDEDVFQPLVKFLESDMTADERDRFFSCTLPYISQCALALKQHKSSMGLSFSLQQQVDNRKISHEFVSSLVAHSFFSSFPKRTSKTHPTLQDFNFSNFFLQLDQSFQQVKFRCLLHYFDCLSKFGHPQEPISISRQVMTGREWLTIEDWLECNLPLCPLSIKHDGRLERFDSSDSLLVCSSSSRLGGHVLNAGSSRECIQFCECPELIALLLFFEALEDNEVCIVENVLKVAKISDVRQKTNLELLEEPQPMYLCLMDAENYTRLPLSQYEEDNVLRELNKALLGFRQKQQQTQQVLHNSRQHSVTIGATTKRLSPIGESFSSTPPPEPDLDLYSHSAKARRSFSKRGHSGSNGVKGGDWGGARLAPPSTGKWIMLGSSGECLPISRHQCMPIHSSVNRNDSKDEDTFYSANSSFDQDDDDDKYDDVFLDDNEAVTSPFKYECELKTPERRHTFAERLKEALQREQSNGSSDSSYAVGISVAGSSLTENNIRMRRGGSRGFMLEDSFGTESSPKTEKHKARRRQAFSRGNSSRYSFSTEYTSELEEVYEQLSRWLDESDLSTVGLEDDSGSGTGSGETRQRLRDRAVVQFAGSLLKRTLSESFVGVPLTDHRDELEETDYRPDSRLKHDFKIKLAARSLSLELQKHRHKLAAQLVSVLAQQEAGLCDLLPVVTGNWGCGTRQLGDPQLKLLIQWLAGSVAGIPTLIYCTYGHYKLLKLDTVCRVILDRKWSVGELVAFILRYVQFTLGHSLANQEADTLFEYIISRDHAL
nr:PREDICTED: uncharacterized protein LOC109030650 isoform X1 [Bemisia tabaci]